MAYKPVDNTPPLTPLSATFTPQTPTSPYSNSLYAESSYSTGTGTHSLAKLHEKSVNDYAPVAYTPPAPNKSKRKIWILSGGGFLVILAAAAVVVYFVVLRKPVSSENGSSSQGTSKLLTSGTDGSNITTEDGTVFTYYNKFGGNWVWDPKNPYNDSARPNSWTPPLEETWQWENNRIYGVNLGGWFVLEPFISPALFEKYPNAVDEYTLSQAMAADTAGGGLDQLETHYDTFITEEDIAKIAGAGLNWVRLPVPYWAIETWPGEPFLAEVSWKYILRAIGWCRKYGIRVNLDLHTAPGSQNGMNHSGKFGQINFLNGPMGFANAQRMLEYIRVYTEFFSQPAYKNVVCMFSVVNEAWMATIGKDTLWSFYYQVHQTVRGITGFGEGNGPYIGVHDGFTAATDWVNFLPGADRFVLDTHPYFSFSGSPATEPIAEDGTGGIWPKKACDAWAPPMNASRSSFGPTVGGEFSGGFNDCGKYLKGTLAYKTDYGGDCSYWEDASKWNQTTKEGVKAFVSASMDALGDFFFWTWKIGNSSVTGVPTSPLWSYSLGLELGYIPSDPRTVNGICAGQGTSVTPFAGQYKPTQTGGAGAGTIDMSAASQYAVWPPASIVGASAPYISYAATGTIVSLTPSSYASATKTASAWFNAQDTTAAPTPFNGCTYPDAWTAASASGETTAWSCAATGVMRRMPSSTPTAM